MERKFGYFARNQLGDRSMPVEIGKCEMAGRKFGGCKKLIQDQPDVFTAWLESEIKRLLSIPNNIFQENLKSPPKETIKKMDFNTDDDNLFNNKEEESVTTIEKHNNNNEVSSSSSTTTMEMSNNNLKKFQDDNNFPVNHCNTSEKNLSIIKEKFNQNPTAMTWFSEEVSKQLTEVNDNVNKNFQHKLSNYSGDNYMRNVNDVYYEQIRHVMQSKLAWAALTKKNKKERRRMKSNKQSVVSDLGSPSDLDVMDLDDVESSNHTEASKKVLAGYLVTLDKKYELYNGVNRIGKINSGDIQIADEEDKNISKEHAIIYISDELGWYLKHQSYHSDTILYRVNLIGKTRRVYEEKLKIGDWYELPGKCTVIFGRYPAVILGERIAHHLLSNVLSELSVLTDKLNQKEDEQNKEVSNSFIKTEEDSNNSHNENNSEDSLSIESDCSCSFDDQNVPHDKRKNFESNKENISIKLVKKKKEGKCRALNNNHEFESSSSNKAPFYPMKEQTLKCANYPM